MCENCDNFKEIDKLKVIQNMIENCSVECLKKYMEKCNMTIIDFYFPGPVNNCIFWNKLNFVKYLTEENKVKKDYDFIYFYSYYSKYKKDINYEIVEYLILNGYDKLNITELLKLHDYYINDDYDWNHSSLVLNKFLDFLLKYDHIDYTFEEYYYDFDSSERLKNESLLTNIQNILIKECKPDLCSNIYIRNLLLKLYKNNNMNSEEDVTILKEYVEEYLNYVQMVSKCILEYTRIVSDVIKYEVMKYI
jgi:hypothetical protein